jgi:mRNA-degrading endonuclease RelE of RelBE toxin-antitoxin system
MEVRRPGPNHLPALEVLGTIRGFPSRRLRVGEVRVFYDVSGATVEVLAIVAKSEAESWLAQFANPE